MKITPQKLAKTLNLMASAYEADGMAKDAEEARKKAKWALEHNIYAGLLERFHLTLRAIAEAGADQAQERLIKAREHALDALEKAIQAREAGAEDAEALEAKFESFRLQARQEVQIMQAWRKAQEPLGFSTGPGPGDP